VILGAQKCGTTSLYDYMVQHPQVLPAWEKEVHYFDLNYARGERWYRSHFAKASALTGESGERITGEATPYYLFHPHVPGRLRSLLPDARLIVLLRDPVDRTISHYRHEVRAGRETLSLSAALEAEVGRIEPEYRRLLAEPGYEAPRYQRYSYRKRSVYADQLIAYLELFPQEQILVLRSEDLFARPEPTLGRVFEHLRIGASFRPPDLRARNVNRQRDEVPAAIRAELARYFAPQNRRLEELLGRSFGWDSGL
jgi:hypothetical protein